MNGARVRNKQVNGASNFRRAAPVFKPQEQRILMIVVATDYKRTGRPLSCTAAAKSVEELARQCGVCLLDAIYDDQCTCERVLAAVKDMTPKCRPDDFFILYMAGHGASPEGADSQAAQPCFVLVDRNGQVSSSTLMPGDEIAAAVLEGCKEQTRVLFIVDTCFSDPIIDLRRGGWHGRQAIVLAGTQEPNSTDEDRGALATHAMLLAIDKLSKVGRENYSAGMLFNAALHENELVFNGAQDLNVQSSPGFATDMMAWPLVPQSGYLAPLTRCCGIAGGLTESSARRNDLSPALVPYVRMEALNIPVSIEEYVSSVQGQSMFNLKLHRACNAGCSTDGCCVQ